MTTKALFDDDGNVDPDKVSALRRGALIDAMDDLEADLRDAKAADDGSAKGKARRQQASVRVRELRRHIRENGIVVDPDAVNITAPTINSNSHTMNQEA